MATVGNTSNIEYILARDSFFDSDEKEFFEKLFKSDLDIRLMHTDLSKKRAESLYAKAMDLITRAEGGEFDEETMEIIEVKVGLLLSALEELSIEQIKEMDFNKGPER